MAAIQNNQMSVRLATVSFGIPKKTLERRVKSSNKTKLGPHSVFGSAHEQRLVRHIKEMQKSGFPLTRDDLRSMAYKCAVQLGIKHRFNKEDEKAGYVWLQSFLTRHSDISIRKAEGLSLARSKIVRIIRKNYL